MAFCSKCGNQVTDGTKFCSNCGNDVSAVNNQQQMNSGQADNQQTGYTQTNAQGNYNQTNYGQQNHGQQNYGGNGPSFMNTSDTTAQYSMDDINNNKVMAVISYLGLLWLIPFLGAKNSPFAKYHVKQAFLVICAEVVWSIVSGIVNFAFRNHVSGTWLNPHFGTPTAISLILWVVNIVLFAFSIMGIINAVQGKAKELPFIGKFSNKLTFLK